MLLFWILAAALLLIATVFILLPLIKKQPRENNSEPGTRPVIGNACKRLTRRLKMA